jgi:IclR family KDG regulon transcriptional repressor
MRRISRQFRHTRGSEYAQSQALEYSSVQKAIGILLSFLPDNRPAGNLELSKSLGMNKSTVSRLARVLTYYGFLQQDDETQKYELGRTSAHLGLAVETSQSERLAQLGQRYVDHLRDIVKESVCLETLDAAGYVNVICSAVGPPPLSVTFPETVPMHVAAGAKVILAFSDQDFTESMINDDFTKLTDNTITDPAVFREQLDEIKQRGLAYDHGEANADIHTASVAVFNHM